MAISFRLLETDPPTPMLVFTLSCDNVAGAHAIPPPPLRIETDSAIEFFKRARAAGWSFSKTNDVRCPECKR